MEPKEFLITDENVNHYLDLITKFIKTTVDNSGCQGVVLGMSGGVDCSVVARLCQLANVKIKLYLLPDGFDQTKKSYLDAMELINKFNFDYQIKDIRPICTEIEKTIDDNLLEISKINIRPRIRMTLLYAFAQNQNSLVVGTGNYVERTLGYFTKWGDGACDFNPLGMLTKQEVRLLATVLGVPESIIKKAPSADLYDHQTDEGEFGFSYQQADDYLLNKTSGDLIIDQKIQRRINQSHHKNQPINIFKG